MAHVISIDVFLKHQLAYPVSRNCGELFLTTDFQFFIMEPVTLFWPCLLFLQVQVVVTPITLFKIEKKKLSSTDMPTIGYRLVQSIRQNVEVRNAQ